MSDTRGAVEHAMARAELPAFTFEDFERRRIRRQRTQRLAAIAVAVVLFTVPAGLLVSADQASVPAGLPASSDGLVVEMHARPGSGDPFQIPVHEVWVYEDGRVISRNEGPIGMDSEWYVTPLVERQLTSEGLAMLRAELLSTSLFGFDRRVYRSSGGLVWGGLGLSIDGRWSEIDWCCPNSHPAPDEFDRAGHLTDEQADSLIRVTDGLADLSHWLPAVAWVDPVGTRYVPERWAVCAWGWGRRPTVIHPADVLDALPAGVRRLIVGRYEVFDPFNSTEIPANDPVTCAVVEPAMVGDISAIFRRAGAEPLNGWVSDGFIVEAEPGDLTFTFEPILPHGEFSLMGS